MSDGINHAQGKRTYGHDGYPIVPQSASSRVHIAIMNLPCKEHNWASGHVEAGYLIGCQEIRYSAVEIAQAAIAELEEELARLRGVLDKAGLRYLADGAEAGGQS